MIDRQKRLLCLIEAATGKNSYFDGKEEEGVNVEVDADEIEVEHTISL